MNSLENLIYGFSICFIPENLLAVMIGVLVGTAIGVLPGLGPVGTMAILMPITLKMGPAAAIIMLAGIWYGAQYGGSITSILVSLPGEASSVITVIDGYQMTKKGRAGAALTVAAVGSFIAGTLGIIGLMLFAPTLAKAALSFGPPEYFAIALLGVFALSRLSGGSFWYSLIVLTLGLVLATVGMDMISAGSRYTFGIVQLRQGIDVVPVVMGLYGIAEVLCVAEEQTVAPPRAQRVRLRELFPTGSEWRRSLPAMFRGAGLGFLVGLIPGPAVITSTFVSYKLERQISKHRDEFGHGAIEGVAGPESANNGAQAGGMVPLMSLGIPFSPAGAILLAVLLMHGVMPGPLLISQHPAIFWGVVASMYLGNLALLVLNLPLVGMWVTLLRIPQSVLLSLILLFTLIGSYSINNSILDLVVLVVMGVFGYVFRKLSIDVAPMVLALVLGPMLELNLRQSLYMSRGDFLIFFERPISGSMFGVLFLIMIGPLICKFVAKQRQRA